MSSSVPDGWKNETIGTYVEKMVGGAPLRPSDFSKAGVRVIPKKAVQFGGKTKFKVKTYCTTDFASNNQKNIVNNEYIITSLRDLVPTGPTIGVIGKLEEQGEFILAQGVYGLKIKNIIDYYLIQLSNSQWYRQQMRLIFVGSTQVHIRNQEFLDVVIPIPPLPEQQKIAQILTSVDEVIEKTQAQIDKLKDLKTAMMQELLTKGIGHVEFKDSAVGRIPVEWDVVTMREVTKVIDSLHLTPTFSMEGLPMVRVSDIRWGKVNLDKTKKVSGAVFEQFTKNHQPMVGDLLMSRVGSYGVCCYVDKDTPLCIGQNTVVIVPNSINYLYLFYCINSSIVQKQIEFEVAGSGYKSLSLASIREIKLTLPSINEQIKIAESFESIDNKIEVIKTKLTSVVNTKKALMQDLLTGKVRVNTEQPNSALALG